MTTERLRPNQKVELAGGIKVAIGAVDVPTPIGPIACWSYLTEGFLRHGQADLLFLLRRTPLDPEPSPVPLHAMAALAAQGSLGEIAPVGGGTPFPPDPYFAQRGWGGWMYLPSQRGSGVAPQTLHAISVTADELAVAREVGATRIAARFGRAASFWPCPPWSEPHPSFAGPDDTKHSILSTVRVIGGLDISVTRAGERMRLRLPRRAAAELKSVLGDTSIALSAVLGEEADGCLVWNPGQVGTAAIHAPGSTGLRLGAAFLLLAPGADADAAVLTEDGITARLTDASWTRLRAGLAAAAPASVLLGELRLELEWV